MKKEKEINENVNTIKEKETNYRDEVEGRVMISLLKRTLPEDVS